MAGLENFLATEEGEAAPAEPTPPVAIEEPQGEPAPVAEAPEKIAEPVAAAEDEEGAPPAPESDDVKGLRAALQAERGKRNDYKGERDRLAGEVAALKAQMDAFAKAPPPPPSVPVQQAPQQPPQQAQPAPDPATQPVEFARWQQAQIQAVIRNERFNVSEAVLRRQLGSEEVDAKIAIFKKAAETNPVLQAQLEHQPDPYGWAYEQAKRIQAMEEIGPDPGAFRAKLEADLRAKLEAELREKLQAEYGGVPVRPAPNLTPSLGTARSAAPRSAEPVSAPDFYDVFKRPRKQG